MKMSRAGIAVVLGLMMVSPIASASYLYGIDVSHWRTVTDWNAVRNSGKTFMFTKASEDTTYVDPTLNAYMTGAHNAGLYAGAFHFATPYGSERGDTSGPNDAIAEADHFVDTIQPYLTEGYLRPVLDLETAYEVGKTRLSTWVNDFVERVKYRTRLEPIIYTSSWYARNFFDSSIAEYDLWLARWTRDTTVPPTAVEPGVWGADGWSFWQYTDQESVPGVTWTVDGDVFNGTEADLLEDFVIPLTADANRDGLVDVADLGILAAHYGTTSGATWRQGDFNNTGTVDVSDLGILAAHYGEASAWSLPVGTVPEPLSLVLLVLGGLGAIGRKR